MSKQNKVSVIIPCHNDGKFLQEAVDSVLQQPWQNLEVIIMDDGSTDKETLHLLQSINHGRVQVFFNPPKGVSATRNEAIAKATGTYILPLDADDKLGVRFLKQAVDVLENNPDIKLVAGKIKMFGRRSGIKPMPPFTFETLLARNTFAVTSLFRKKDFLQTNGFNINMKSGFEDWDFWISLLENGGEVAILPVVAVNYRVKKRSRNSSLTSQHFQKLRRQLYDNHREAYARHFIDPLETFEYELLLNSREYQLGKKLLKPVRSLYKRLSR